MVPCSEPSRALRRRLQAQTGRQYDPAYRGSPAIMKAAALIHQACLEVRSQGTRKSAATGLWVGPAAAIFPAQ
jgi:hypothetical protein